MLEKSVVTRVGLCVVEHEVSSHTVAEEEVENVGLSLYASCLLPSPQIAAISDTSLVAIS